MCFNKINGNKLFTNFRFLKQFHSSSVGEKHQPLRSAYFFLEHQKRQKSEN